MNSEIVWAKYGPKMHAFMERGRQAMTTRGYTDLSQVDDFTDEEYCLSICGTRPDGVKVDAMLYLVEEKCREGEGSGVSFHLSLCEEGGRIIGDYSPYNYTPDLWCRTERQLAERWQFFEYMDWDWEDPDISPSTNAPQSTNSD